MNGEDRQRAAIGDHPATRRARVDEILNTEIDSLDCRCRIQVSTTAIVPAVRRIVFSRLPCTVGTTANEPRAFREAPFYPLRYANRGAETDWFGTPRDRKSHSEEAP